jgi:hypothetical protein
MDDLEPSISRTRIRAILDAGGGLVGQRVVVGGWVVVDREQGRGAFAFLTVSDGSSPPPRSRSWSRPPCSAARRSRASRPWEPPCSWRGCSKRKTNLALSR